MKGKWFNILAWAALLAGAIVLVVGAAGRSATARGSGMALPTSPASARAVGDVYTVLNEIMPKPASGEPAWVELYVDQVMQRVYLPAILQASTGSFAQAPSPLAAAPPAVPQAVPTINLAGWQVSNETGQSYALPAALNAVPKGTYILILFDETGPAGNDTDPSDGLVTLHTPAGLGDIFPDEAGQAALYSSGSPGPDTIQDFAAWGEASESAAANAVAAGIWGAGQAVSFENGFGDLTPEDLLEPDESLGRFPGAMFFGAANWSNYPAGSLTPGAANPVQPVLFVTPEPGAKVDTSTLSFSWRSAAGATGYQFQLDNNADFSSPLLDVFTLHTYYKPDPALAAGIYYWRINPLFAGQPGGWTVGMQIEAAAPSLAHGPDATIEKVLDIARVRQNKDSYLLGLDGAPEGDPTTNTPENAWDSPAPCTTPPCVDDTKYMHGNMYCVRASIRMVASWYHSNPADVLSMDRISYHILQEWSGNTNPGTNDSNPNNDLGYNRGMYYPDEEDEGFAWAMNISYSTPGGKPSFADVKTWIDDDRPIMFRRPGHMMVINGYREIDGTDQYLHILDPDQPPDFERWQDYSTQTISGYWVGPTSGTSRKDETSVWTDSDSDGIMDFDETLRFHTDPYDADTDGDWVRDKQDMREYVFDASGNYSYRTEDQDGDTLRKELDFDNDADGTPEGCEDTNFNGIYEAGLGETDNFNAGSNQVCHPIFGILYPLKTAPVNAGAHEAPDKILVQVSAAVPAGWSLSLVPGDFTVEIGGLSASVLAVYPSSDTYFLVVDPPSQASAAFYDLSVSLSGSGSDSEADAVYYLEKAPNDEVIVLDRSGSMLSDDKIGAAKNAASAFVDFLNDGDMVGVASFASSASEDYSLTQITAASVRTDAINAIDGLTASGTTALGQGVQTGYGMLTADGAPDDDWSLVLLSDGWENVAPYWADVAPTVTDAVVHTVALGEDADTALLQSIAGAKHGNYFYVDVQPPVVASLNQPVGGPPLAIATTLPNRLADTYLSIGELTHGYQRLDSRLGTAIEPGTQTFQVTINKNTPLAVFTLNWDDPAGYLAMVLTDPSGNPVTPNAEYRSDTHHQMHVRNPKSGLWKVDIRVLKPTLEYNFMLSGKNNTSLIAAVGGSPRQHTVGMPVRIYGVLTDYAPIKGADVYALASGMGIPAPGLESPAGTAFLQLFDDGNHGDGKPDDGLYANDLVGIQAPGGVTVKLVAAGTNNDGETFLRYASTGFNVLPRAAYLFDDNLDKALSYRSLLEDNGWAVDLVPLADVPGTNFTPYSVIVVGPDTGYGYDFDDAAAAAALAQWNKPFLGLGSGGAALFQQFDLFVNYGQTWVASNHRVYPTVPTSNYWREPYYIETRDPSLVTLYPKPLRELGVYIPTPLKTVTPIAQEENNKEHFPVVREVRGAQNFIFWGYDEAPNRMTEDGRKLIINLIQSLR